MMEPCGNKCSQGNKLHGNGHSPHGLIPHGQRSNCLRPTALSTDGIGIMNHVLYQHFSQSISIGSLHCSTKKLCNCAFQLCLVWMMPLLEQNQAV